MKRARCRRCYFLNRNGLTDEVEQTDEPFCGLHGQAPIDPDGKQPDLDHEGGCGFIPNEEECHEQLTLF